VLPLLADQLASTCAGSHPLNVHRRVSTVILPISAVSHTTVAAPSDTETAGLSTRYPPAFSNDRTVLTNTGRSIFPSAARAEIVKPPRAVLAVEPAPSTVTTHAVPPDPSADAPTCNGVPNGSATLNGCPTISDGALAEPARAMPDPSSARTPASAATRQCDRMTL